MKLTNDFWGRLTYYLHDGCSQIRPKDKWLSNDPGEGVTEAGTDKLQRHQQRQTGRAEESERGHNDTLI